MKFIYNIFGLKGSGKDTVGYLIRKLHQEGDVIHESFASYLKEMVYTIFGSSLKFENVYGNIFNKEKPIDLLISEKLKIAFPILAKHEYWSGRLLLQFLGTEICREINSDCWTELLISKIITCNNSIVLTDCRFPNEYAALNSEYKEILENSGFKVINIRIDRNIENSDLHESELHCEKFETNCILKNTGSMKELEESVKYLLTLIEKEHANT